jgi:predicted SnoaL-like aldol condensation-catalyzing enzyme
MRTALIFASALVAVLAAQGQAPATNQADANKAVVRRAFQALEQGDVKTLNEVYDPRGLVHSPRGKTTVQGGPFTDLKSTCPMCASLSNRKITVDQLLSDGDLVAVRSTWSGKYSGTIRGMAVPEKDVSIVYTNIYRIADGKIVENWYQSDNLSLAEQLGMKLTPADTSK